MRGVSALIFAIFSRQERLSVSEEQCSVECKFWSVAGIPVQV